MTVVTLKKRREFLRLRGGKRWSTPGFLLEGRPRQDGQPVTDGPRFGFTVTKKMGNAVRRNRIRRRLKAAIESVAATRADPRFDYVILARRPALDRAFHMICSDLETAFASLTSKPTNRAKRRSRGIA
ncbi:MAG: ribonuclease P protein component [Hyphomicrobiaceae bacterium]